MHCESICEAFESSSFALCWIRAKFICNATRFWPVPSCNSRAIRRRSSSCKDNKRPESSRRSSSARLRSVISVLICSHPTGVPFWSRHNVQRLATVIRRPLRVLCTSSPSQLPSWKSVSLISSNGTGNLVCNNLPRPCVTASCFVHPYNRSAPLFQYEMVPSRLRIRMASVARSRRSDCSFSFNVCRSRASCV